MNDVNNNMKMGVTSRRGNEGWNKSDSKTTCWQIFVPGKKHPTRQDVSGPRWLRTIRGRGGGGFAPIPLCINS